MNIGYFREMKDHHLVIGAEEVQCPEYQIKMIRQNKIEGLLCPVIRLTDGETEYDYLITGCQSLQTFVEEAPIPGELLSSLVEALCRLLEQMDRYMIDADLLVLRPEFIYLEREKQGAERVKYCLFPFRTEAVDGQLRELFKFILNEVDYQDKQVVDLAYELFQEVSQEPVNLTKLRELAQMFRGSAPESPEDTRAQVVCVDAAQEPVYPVAVQSEEILWLDEPREEKKKNRKLLQRKAPDRKTVKEREITLPVCGKKSILGVMKSGGNLK